MRLTVLTAAAMGSVVALVGFAGAANASATIDLIWPDTGTNEISDLVLPTTVTLNVILTAGPNGSRGAGVSVDNSTVLGQLAVIGFASTPSGPLPLTLGSTIDTGARVENINSGALPPSAGIGLAAGQSHQLGTVTFDTSGRIGNFFEIPSDANGLFDGVFDLAGHNITPTTTFNSAFLVPHGDPPRCTDSQGHSPQIEVNALRAGGTRVSAGPNQTVDVTAKARILKGKAVCGSTIDTTLTIEAMDGTAAIGTNSTAFEAVRLEVGKGGKGAKLAVDVPQCNSGFIDFVATFTGVDGDNDECTKSRTLRKECR
jgi:hypothetical protein